MISVSQEMGLKGMLRNCPCLLVQQRLLAQFEVFPQNILNVVQHSVARSHLPQMWAMTCRAASGTVAWRLCSSRTHLHRTTPNTAALLQGCDALLRVSFSLRSVRYIKQYRDDFVEPGNPKHLLDAAAICHLDRYCSFLILEWNYWFSRKN